MRKILFVAALALGASSAVAADLPTREPAPAPVYSAPIFTWTGFYVGVNAGAAWGAGCSNIRPGIVVAGWNNQACNGGDDGLFLGGAQIGYNWQSGSMVYGLEADLQAISNKNGGSGAYVFGGGLIPAGTYSIYGHRGPNLFGTVRARLGYAVDRALFYVTGGLAYGSGSQSARVWYRSPAGGTANWTAGSSGDKVGWTLGAGIEYAVTNNWTVKAEYLYADLGNRNSIGTVCAGGNCAAFPINYNWTGGRNRSQYNVVRVGVNYLFSSPAAPVVSKY